VRRRPAVSVAATLVAASLVVAGAGTASASRRPLRRVVATYAVPVRACRTATAVAWHRGPRIPSTRRVALPKRIAAQVALYLDQYSATAVLAPRGWGCTASYAEDGAGLFFVYSPRERSPGYFPSMWPHRRSARRELVVQTNPSCVACVLAQACPYFAHARHLMHLWGYWGRSSSTACRVPRGERVRELSSSLMSLVDPPRVLGNQVPSGGPYAALGEVGYTPVGREHVRAGSFLMTCALPPQDHALCYASLHWFARTAPSVSDAPRHQG
jgi:hypothetical protein